MSYSLLDGYKTASQSNAPWALTFRPTLKAPVIANRIFDTLEHAQAYVDDDSLVIYTNDFTLGNKIDFNTDVKIDDESFIANYEADSQGQVLTLFL